MEGGYRKIGLLQVLASGINNTKLSVKLQRVRVVKSPNYSVRLCLMFGKCADLLSSSVTAVG